MRNNLISIFDGIKDPRKIDRCLYELGDLLAVVFLTYLSGLEDNSDMALYASSRSREFGLFTYTDRNPSADTFERLFATLKTDFSGKGHYRAREADTACPGGEADRHRRQETLWHRSEGKGSQRGLPAQRIRD